MNLFYPFYTIYKIIVYIFSIFTNAIMGDFTNSTKKIRWDENKNTVHFTYSKYEYDRSMIKRDTYSILPFNREYF
jgi:hypothetical protein